MAHVSFRPCSKSDESAITDFLWSVKDELLLREKSDAVKITQILFEKGGILAGYDNDTLIAMAGYFIGEPSSNYTNKEVGFVYVTALAKPYRLSRTMLHGMDYTMRHLHKLGVKEIRCHASEHDPYTNRLYSHFAKPLGQDVTLRGMPAILYGNTIEEILAYLDKTQARQQRTESHPKLSTAVNGATISDLMSPQLYLALNENRSSQPQYSTSLIHQSSRCHHIEHSDQPRT